jgi:putative transposase
MPSSYCNLRVHMVWSTKDRKSLIEPLWEDRLFEYLGGILTNRKHVLLAAGGTGDHIHLLVGQHPTESVSDLVRDLKSNSSAWIHREIPDQKTFGWQLGYGAFSVSKSNEATVFGYIQNQKEHHRTHSFKGEFLGLLIHHEIEFDERYIWE